MLAPASFTDAIVAVHILAVILSFGVLFIYPLLRFVGVRQEPQAASWFHRLQYAVHMRIQAPGLVVVLLAGIYLASKEHQWSAFYVGWGFAAVIVIGGIGGAYISPREKRLIALADAEGGHSGSASASAVVSAPSAGSATASTAGDTAGASEEYRSAARQADLARLAQLAITVLTVFFMALHVGA